MTVFERVTVAEIDHGFPFFIMIYYMINDLWVGGIVSQFSDVERIIQRS
jgi:hypothetical protein